MAQDHAAAALRTLLVERDVRNLLTLVQPSRGLAVGISRARHELAEAAALEHHRTSAVLAVLLLRSLLDIGAVQFRQVDGVFLGEGAGIGIALVVGAAGEERPVL